MNEIDLSPAGVLAGALATALSVVLSIIAGLYWALAREKLVTGAQHTREIATMAKAADLVTTEHATELERLRADQAATIARILAERTVQLDRKDADMARREVELQATIAQLRADNERVFGAWHITDDALTRLTDARITASGEMMRTVLEALRHSPLADQLPALEQGGNDAGHDDRRS